MGSHRKRTREQQIAEQLRQIDAKHRRAKTMAVVDALGMPANNQPQPQQQVIHPLLGQVFIPWYHQAQAILLQGRAIGKGIESYKDFDPEETADDAFKFAVRAFANIGFRFVAPLGFEVIQAKPELQT
jgi:hypothetical protein